MEDAVSDPISSVTYKAFQYYILQLVPLFLLELTIQHKVKCLPQSAFSLTAGPTKEDSLLETNLQANPISFREG